jgi:hypothetical protein
MGTNLSGDLQAMVRRLISQRRSAGKFFSHADVYDDVRRAIDRATFDKNSRNIWEFIYDEMHGGR